MQWNDLLLTISEELSGLVATVSTLQATLGDVLHEAATIKQDSLWQMQEIDRLQQSLDDLATILRTASREDSEQVDVERLARVAQLGAIRDRLCKPSSREVDAQRPGFVAIF